MAATRMIRLLGRPHADAARARGNKPWAITAYLALAGGPVTRDRLITLLFEDADDPAGALRWNLGQVRRLLGQPDALRGRVLILRGMDVAFDVDLLTKGRWQDAVELPALGGELLEGLQFPDSPAYEVWLLGERRHLAAATETLLQEAALSAMSTGNLADAVGWANRLVCVNPRVDSHQELLIRAYAISGDHVAARRQLEAAVRLFRRELSCDPAPSVFLAAETSPAKATGPASPARVHALVEAGQVQTTAGATEAAIQVMRTACDEAARTGNAALEATAQLALGATLIDAGTARRQDGELALHRAIALAEASGEPRLAASAYRYLAGSDVLRGSYSRADRQLAAAEAITVPDPDERVELAAIRGVSLLDQGDTAGAIALFRAGLAADPDRAHPFLPIMLTHTGRAHLLAGDLQAARTQLEDGLQIARARAWAGVTAAPLALLGHVAVAEGNLDAARELLEQAFALACQVADPCWETWAVHGLGLHAAAAGDEASALSHLADAITRSRPQRGGHLWSHVWALTQAVPLARRAADPQAEPWYDEALTTAQRSGMRSLARDLLQLSRPSRCP
jgi:DNA-binding SARP family transcriptional activator